MKLRRNLLLAAAALILVGSFFLPNAVASITDARRLDNLRIIGAQSFSFNIAGELLLHSRIELASSPNTEIIVIEKGARVSEEAARERAAAEIGHFFSGGGIGGGPFEFDYEDCVVDEGTAMFLISSQDPSVNMVVWTFDAADPNGNSVTITMDEEYGSILRMVYRRGIGNPQIGYPQWFEADIRQTPRASDDELYAAALHLTEMLGAYYQSPILLGDYQFSGGLAYYRADFYEQDEVIPMYGVVRATSFTVNERV